VTLSVAGVRPAFDASGFGTHSGSESSRTKPATLDHNGQLVAQTKTTNTTDPELGIPAGTTIFTAHYTPPVIVDTPGVAP